MISRFNSGFDNAALYEKLKNQIGVQQKEYDWNKVPNVSRATRANDLRQLGIIMTRHIYRCGTTLDNFMKRVDQDMPGEPPYGELMQDIQSCIKDLNEPVSVAATKK